jgi:hypothetical protein
VIVALGLGGLKEIFAKPFPAVPTMSLGAVGGAACARVGISENKIAPIVIATIWFFLFDPTQKIIAWLKFF